ncbi:MAG: type I-D CRISPR-associated helicase Cas3' [Ktedonobacteraceae bacterium]
MIELELAAHYEALASPDAEDYQKLADALKAAPLYHQWCTYKAKDASIVVNSYNTGTGKTKAALLRLLDLDEAYRNNGLADNANVLFIAPTNELLRQHEQDVQDFIHANNLKHIVLRLDAATIKELGQQHLGEKFTRQGDRLYQMLEDPRAVTIDDEGYHPEGHRPYVLVINPDIFYYALYGLGNTHDQRVLFRAFVEKFQYIIVDEFHYYNAKQCANFLFFLTLSREWGYFARGRTVCLLTATPTREIKAYLQGLHLSIAFIEPGHEPDDLLQTPALAPVTLQLWSTEAFTNGLVGLASEKQSEVIAWLQNEQHGAFISSALWRINELYKIYGGKSSPYTGRLTGAEQAQWREQHKYAALLMATPTVDIGYNFSRPGKLRQSIDFLFFDARSSDECIQRLGRAARILGKPICTIPSKVYAIVPDELLQGLQQVCERDGNKLERGALNALINELLPQKNGIYAYIRSGAIAEAFLPLYHMNKALASNDKQQAEELYQAISHIYGTKNKRSFASLAWNIQKYLKIKALLPNLLKEAKSKRFGVASVIVHTIDKQPEIDLAALDSITEARAYEVENTLLQHKKLVKAEVKRRYELEEYYVTATRFNFRDHFQPPLALAHDPEGFLSTAEYTTYSALHIVQNYQADWYDAQHYAGAADNAGQRFDKQFQLCCELRKSREQRLHLYFKLAHTALTKSQWEERYCSQLAAADGLKLQSDDGPVPAEINALFEQNYVTFYAVPAIGPEGLALVRLTKITSLFLNRLRVEFGDEGEHEYMFVVGTAALLVACENNVINAKYKVKKEATQGSHLFDWELG